jgi:ABC-2 type transport system ATP-binding protein
VNVVETSMLAKRYGKIWALRDCSTAIPRGRIAAFVGPNGAGKTTLLHLMVGLAAPTAGSVKVLGGIPAGSARALERIAFVAQDAPLYKGLHVTGMLDLAACLNQRFDRQRAESRLAELGIALGQKVGRLSGGQQAQLALTIAFARHPDLLILDEPLAGLDPLARHDFMASLMIAAAEDGLSVVFSSHIVGELERVADYLVLLTGGRVQVSGEIAGLVSDHATVSMPASDAGRLPRQWAVIRSERAGHRVHLLIRAPRGTGTMPPGWEAGPVTLEELILAYLRTPQACAPPVPFLVSSGRPEGPAA